MNKYNARKTSINGIVFDSKREASRYQELKLLEKAGEITNLVLQPSFLLQEPFKRRGKQYRSINYIADFQYREERTGLDVIEDVKGTETEVFRIKKKLFLFLYGKVYDFRIIK